MILLKIVQNAELVHLIMQNKKYKIFIIAGEVSGDILGAKIISEMPDMNFVGIGGENMINAGLRPIFPMSDLAVMGVIEVLAHARTLTRRIKQTAQAILDERPDLVLTIDAPGFAKRVVNLVKSTKSGAELINNGMRFHHFVAPQVWAWRPGRAKKYTKTFDKLYAFFDFEIPYFTKHGLPTIAVGHPTADELVGRKDTDKTSDKIITLIPGSRISEATRLMPLFRDVVERMINDGYNGYKFIIPTVETTTEYIQQEIKTWPITPEIVPSSERYNVYSQTYIALAASGTVTAELAMLHIPTIVVYRMNPISTWIIRQIINTKWVSLVNILLQRTVYPELLGPMATVDNIINTFITLANPSSRKKMISELKSADKLWCPNKYSAITTIANDIRKTISK